MASLPIDTMVFRDDPDVSVVGVGLGFSAWLAEPSGWASQGAKGMLAAFLDDVSGVPLWYRTSLLPDWKPVATQAGRKELIEALPASWLSASPRHFFRFEVADDPQVPSCGFVYVEVDPARAARPSSLELTLPQEGDPKRLARLMRHLVGVGPVLAAVGGHEARWNPLHDRLAFAQIRVWCKRYLGLDVQDVEDMAWRILDGLPGSNWLTFLGPAIGDRLRLDLAELAAGPWSKEIEATPAGGGLLLQAGKEPTTGDVNRGEFPSAYAEVARRLAPSFVKEPPPFRGGFHEEEGTLAWLRRLIEPGGWQ